MGKGEGGGGLPDIISMPVCVTGPFPACPHTPLLSPRWPQTAIWDMEGPINGYKTNEQCYFPRASSLSSESAPPSTYAYTAAGVRFIRDTCVRQSSPPLAAYFGTATGNCIAQYSTISAHYTCTMWRTCLALLAQCDL